MTAQLIGEHRDMREAGSARPMSKRTLRRRYLVVLAFVDVAMVALAFAFASFLRFGDAAHPAGWRVFAVFLPLFLGLAMNSPAYQPKVFIDWRSGVAPLMGALLLATAVLLFVTFYLMASADISRIMLSSALLASTVLLPAGRALIARRTAFAFGGDAVARALIVDGLEVDAPPEVVRMDAQRLGLALQVPEPIFLDRLGQLLHDIDHVVVACPRERRETWAFALKCINIHGEIVVPEFDSLGALSATRFGELATMLVSPGPLRVQDRVIKRGLDLVLAVAALIFLAPLMLLVAAAVKLGSPGPALFVQQRLGYKNRLFNVYKFRSMRVEQSDSAGNRSASRDDDRITRIGRIIRATSIDELPQLLNILKGEMSFVGPRPHALGSLAGDQLFWEVDSRYWHRHTCVPGLTGLAQIRGFRGATHNRQDLVDRLQADLEYVNGWSIWRDISILLATVRVVVHRNAY